MIHSQLDSSVLVGTWVMLALLVIGIIATAIACIANADGDGYGIISGIIGSFITLLVVGIPMFFIWFPFSAQYNDYRPVTGIVQQVTSRFTGDGSGGTNQNFLVQMNNQLYRCDDTRCSGIHKGEAITLVCERSFQFNSPNEGYVCNWGKRGLNR